MIIRSPKRKSRDVISVPFANLIRPESHISDKDKLENETLEMERQSEKEQPGLKLRKKASMGIKIPSQSNTSFS